MFMVQVPARWMGRWFPCFSRTCCLGQAGFGKVGSQLGPSRLAQERQGPLPKLPLQYKAILYNITLCPNRVYRPTREEERMPLPDVTHLQFFILGQLMDGEQTGRQL